MKKIYLVCALLALLSSCKETPPLIDFGGGAVSSDTTFTAAVETPQLPNVLIEISTGASCSNCPGGEAIIDGYQTANPGRVIPIGINSGGLSTPVNRPDLNIFSKYDFRTAKGDQLMATYFGEKPAQPAATFNREKVNGFYFSNSPDWGGTFASRIAVTSTPVNVKITSSYTASTRQAVIKVHVAYTADLTKHQNLTLMLLESNIIDVQEEPTSYDTAYSFQNVLRDIITPVGGSAMMDQFATKSAGRVYERTFVYNVDTAWNAGNCKVVAIVHDNESGDFQVQQAAETALKP